MGTALPNVVIIGAMKAGTSALHDLLARHPDVSMSRPKELNFFFGEVAPTSPADWHRGNWCRGSEWYASHFDAAAAVRGESSPGYTSPDHPAAASRMASLIPGARLIYLVRDPIERAISHYLHHRREDTEQREMAQALLDPASQYLSRGRYHQRLVPFLAHYDRSRVFIVAQEELSTRGVDVLTDVAEYLDLDPERAGWADAARGSRPSTPRAGMLPRRLRLRLREHFAPDADRLRDVCGRELLGWSV